MIVALEHAIQQNSVEPNLDSRGPHQLSQGSLERQLQQDKSPCKVPALNFTVLTNENNQDYGNEDADPLCDVAIYPESDQELVQQLQPDIKIQTAN